MAAIIFFGAAGIVYCAAYFVHCLRNQPKKDAAGAALLVVFASAALLLCLLR